jgi:hypothetical protein
MKEGHGERLPILALEELGAADERAETRRRSR